MERIRISGIVLLKTVGKNYSRKSLSVVRKRSCGYKIFRILNCSLLLRKLRSNMKKQAKTQSHALNVLKRQELERNFNSFSRDIRVTKITSEVSNSSIACTKAINHLIVILDVFIEET